MHQDIDLTKGLPGAPGDLLDIFVFSNIARFHKITANRLSQGTDTPFKRFASVAETYFCPLIMKGLGDTPGDGALISNTKDECCLAIH